MVVSEQVGISFWLMPSEEFRDFYNKLIIKCSSMLDACFLEPHLTVYVGKLGQEECPSLLLEKVCSNLSPITVKAYGIVCKADFSKSFYIQFHHSDILIKINEKICNEINRPSDYILDPHISLCYKQEKIDRKEIISKDIDYLGDLVLFDSIKVVSHPEFIQARSDIDKFTTLHQIRF